MQDISGNDKSIGVVKYHQVDHDANNEDEEFDLVFSDDDNKIEIPSTEDEVIQEGFTINTEGNDDTVIHINPELTIYNILPEGSKRVPGQTY